MKLHIKLMFFAACSSLISVPASAREWQVRMLNKGSSGSPMVFEPSFLNVKVGDTVKFIAVDKGHNAESISGMSPPGATPFKGMFNEEIVVGISRPGLYGYKCLPHLGMGMVGLIQAGPALNKSVVASEADRLPANAKKVMTGLLTKVQ